MEEVKRSERGWAGHFICSERCLFRRNTLLEYNDIKIVVSTVGAMIDIHGEKYPSKFKFETIGYERYYETMAFHSKKGDTRYHDIDVSKQIYFDSKWQIEKLDSDDTANIMHENVVNEITEKLLKGEKYDREG